LLGQNGAGKTTTMNMLSGFTKKSGGQAFMYGLSVSSHMAQLRQIMGVCPQVLCKKSQRKYLLFLLFRSTTSCLTTSRPRSTLNCSAVSRTSTRL